MEEWVQIRELARQGQSVSGIADATGRDRKTVRKALQGDGPKPRAASGRVGQSKLAPFVDYLRYRVDQGCWNAVVLNEEIATRGYTGKLTLVRDWLRPLRQEQRRQSEAAPRFETAPGHQGQVDWGDFGRIWQQGAWQPLHAFVLTLGYSRAHFLTFVTRCDMEHFLACHLTAFEALGIPAELLYDNLKTAILGRRADGSPIFPGRFLDFALFCGFTPKFCKPYRARTKGKVERGIRYVRQNFWVRVGPEVTAGTLDLAGLNARAANWTQETAQRVHGTTGVVVAERLAEERPLLGSLRGRPPYDTAYHTVRKVGRDGQLSYGGVRYQLPLSYAFSLVEVEETLAGLITFRGSGSQRIRAERVAVPPLPTARPPDPGGWAPRAREVRLALPFLPPEVERRDLAVYEEVARGAHA